MLSSCVDCELWLLMFAIMTQGTNARGAADAGPGSLSEASHQVRQALRFKDCASAAKRSRTEVPTVWRHSESVALTLFVLVRNAGNCAADRAMC